MKIRGCFSFGLEHIQSLNIWSPTIGPQEQTVPAHLVFGTSCGGPNIRGLNVFGTK